MAWMRKNMTVTWCMTCVMHDVLLKMIFSHSTILRVRCPVKGEDYEKQLKRISLNP